MSGMIKRNKGDVQIQSLKKGDRFVYFLNGRDHEVTVVKRRLPNKHTALLKVTGIEDGEETLLSLSRTVWVDKI